MKRASNRIGAAEQHTADIEGFFYEGADGSQMAFWTCRTDRASRPHRHDFDEYMIVVSGQYVAVLDGNEHVLGPGDAARAMTSPNACSTPLRASSDFCPRCSATRPPDTSPSNCGAPPPAAARTAKSRTP